MAKSQQFEGSPDSYRADGVLGHVRCWDDLAEDAVVSLFSPILVAIFQNHRGRERAMACRIEASAQSGRSQRLLFYLEEWMVWAFGAL
jgi:hypothetical protein